MDRQISSNEIRKTNARNWLKLGFVVLGLAIALFYFRTLLSKTADLTDFHIAEIERGDVQNTLTASGIVKPTFEQEVNAPVNTEIKQVLLPKGTIVKRADLIMELDQEYTKLEYEQLKDQLSLKRNAVDKLKLSFDKNLRDLDYQDQIKGLRIQELEAQVKDQEHLLAIGGGTEEELEKVQLELKVAQIEKKMLVNDLQFTQQTNESDKEGLELEYNIQQKRLRELQRKLNETSVKAPIDGVITWITEDIGRTVVSGETLVRIANLSNFHIEASSSDRHAEKVVPGLAVNVKINQKVLTGQIETVLPSVENNTVKFLVALDEPNAEILRPNQKVEVFMITDEKKDVLRIKNGSGFVGARSQDIFVIQDGKAVKQRIQKGLYNADYVEIKPGQFQLGQRLIISDTKAYNHLDQFTLK